MVIRLYPERWPISGPKQGVRWYFPYKHHIVLGPARVECEVLCTLSLTSNVDREAIGDLKKVGYIFWIWCKLLLWRHNDPNLPKFSNSRTDWPGAGWATCDIRATLNNYRFLEAPMYLIYENNIFFISFGAKRLFGVVLQGLDFAIFQLCIGNIGKWKIPYSQNI